MAERETKKPLTREQEQAILRSMRKWTRIVDALALLFPAAVAGMIYLSTGEVWLSAAVGIGAVGYFLWNKIRGRRPKDTWSTSPN